jgi:hypothetical protein
LIGIFCRKPSKTRHYVIKSFTYFIPSPPPRKSGYREREFDNLLEKILNSGFEVINSNIEHCNNEKGGMWVHYVLGALTKEAAALNLDEIEIYDVNDSPPEDLEIEYLND